MKEEAPKPKAIERYPLNRSNLFELHRRIAEAEPLPGKRVFFIGDREILNFEALINYASQNSDIQPGGLIVPGGELDKDILSVVDYLRDMLSSGIATPIHEENGAIGYNFRSVEGVDFNYEHAPYESKRLKEEEYRRDYCTRLVEMVQKSKPDLIFLSNFKIILHPVFVQAFESKIVNVHPSVLPLLKGFRPEYRVDQGEEQKASGYTMHLVDIDLDGGPTLFQQCVPIEPRSIEEETKLGKKDYDKKREEAHRLKIIQAQARWSSKVLALVASDTPRKTVSGSEAFDTEGRSGFAQSEEYEHLLEKEYEEWKEKGGDSNITFDEWKKQQKPYSRILFDKGSGWQTVETILGAPQKSDEKGPDIITRYSFKIPVEDNTQALQRFSLLMQLADEIREKRGIGGGIKTGYMQGSPYATAYIELPYDMQQEFQKLIEQNTNMKDVVIEVETKPTRVMTPRKPPLNEEGFDE